MNLFKLRTIIRHRLGPFFLSAFKYNRIGRNLLLGVLLISGIITCLVSAIQLYVEYQRDLQSVASRLASIGDTSVRAITSATWNLDAPLLGIQLQDLTKIPDVAYVRLQAPSFPEISAGKMPTGRYVQAIFPLMPEPSLSAAKIGELTVVASLDEVWSRLWERIGLVLLSQGTKTFVTSLFILLFFQIYIARRLNAIAHFAAGFNMADLDKSLPPGLVSRHNDELDKTARALERMQTSLRQEHTSNIRTTALLKKSEERFEMATTGANVGVWDWYIGQPRLYLSAQCTRMLGYETTEVADTTEAWMALTHPDDRALAVTTLQRYLDGDAKAYELRQRMRHKEGHYLFILTRGVLVRDEFAKPYRMLGTHVDITSLSNAQEAVTRLSAAIEQSPVAVVIARKQTGIVYCNAKFAQMVSQPGPDMIGTGLDKVLAAVTGPASAWQGFWDAYNKEERWSEQVPVGPDPLSAQWYLATINPIFASDHTVSDLLLILEDITDRRRHEQQLIYQASFDALTQLPNRSLVNDRLTQAISMAQRSGQKVGIMFLDLDNFKLINDSMGHAAGDALLVQIAQRLQQSIRQGHTVARFSGDEFLVVLPDVDDIWQIEQIVGRITDTMQQPIPVGGKQVFVTFSIGISCYPDDGATPGVLIQHADAAMYEAKRAGRNTHTFFISALNDVLNQRLRVEAELRHALDRQELCMHYQPIVDMISQRIIGAEALLRWHSPVLGDVSPNDFIELAEQTGLILPIGRWALGKVCQHIHHWNISCGFDGSVAVNLCAKEFQNSMLAGQIAQQLQQHDVKPTQLKLELTERTLLKDSALISTTLHALHGMGIKISIDDFGTGYSALNYLHKFPFSVVKIDQSFVKDISKDSQKAALVRGIINMAHGMNMEVIAEGVEAAEHWDLLKHEHCDMAQGFLIGKPMSCEKFEGLLRTQAQPAMGLAET